MYCYVTVLHNYANQGYPENFGGLRKYAVLCPPPTNIHPNQNALLQNNFVTFTLDTSCITYTFYKEFFNL